MKAPRTSCRRLFAFNSGESRSSRIAAGLAACAPIADHSPGSTGFGDGSEPALCPFYVASRCAAGDRGATASAAGGFSQTSCHPDPAWLGRYVAPRRRLCGRVERRQVSSPWSPTNGQHAVCAAARTVAQARDRNTARRLRRAGIPRGPSRGRSQAHRSDGFFIGGVATMLAATRAQNEKFLGEGSFAALIAVYPVCWAYNRAPGSIPRPRRCSGASRDGRARSM